MTFHIPELGALSERARQAFRANMPGSDAWLWPNNIAVSAKVMAGMTWEAFGFLGYIQRQMFVTTAEGQWIDKHGFMYGLGRHDASYSSGKVAFQGAAGALILPGLVLSRADGARYEVIGAAQVGPDGSVTLSVKALEPGRIGNAVPNVKVSLLGLSDVLEPEGIVHDDGIGLGADPEDDEPYRQRILQRMRFTPHAGAPHDYVRWVREVPGVSRVFVERIAFGPGSVGIWFLMDEVYPTGIPQQADADAIIAHLHDVAPAGADFRVVLPVPVPVDVEISGFSPDTGPGRDAVRAELADLFYRTAQIGTPNTPFTLYPSKIWQAVAQAEGEDHHTLVLPAAPQTFSDSQFPVLGEVTFT